MFHTDMHTRTHTHTHTNNQRLRESLAKVLQQKDNSKISAGNFSSRYKRKLLETKADSFLKSLLASAVINRTWRVDRY